MKNIDLEKKFLWTDSVMWKICHHLVFTILMKTGQIVLDQNRTKDLLKRTTDFVWVFYRQDLC